MGDTGTPKRHIKTAVRVFELINVIQDLQQATFTEISKETEMAESTLHDYLSTLVHLGYLSRESGKYKLSLQFLDHGTAARESISIYSKSRQTLKGLAEESGAAVWLVVEENGKAVYLAQELGEDSIETHERIGKHEYMHCLATGKVILAFSSQEHVEEVVEQHGLPQMTPESITTIEELQAELSEIREQRYAVNHNEAAKGTSAVAAPVVIDGQVIGAVAISAPVMRVQNEKYREKLIELVLTGSNEIELKMTYD
ncbi:transcriptional regulator, IclR family [Halogranum amylolyticum]|uniref:Transcriptional regulator, IclR family n=1 Tax=Halogranum amylolyticum TaxID=660520 RepID=A0A1H8UEF1_9EURY|nr:IclR family transcriptional regulator [Halogranum amylolyticum]SEP01263.1 transcriptional regulator, IclR family [Halogranum amylolyticum]